MPHPPPRPTLFPYTTLFRSDTEATNFDLMVEAPKKLNRPIWQVEHEVPCLVESRLGLITKWMDDELFVSELRDRKSTRLNSSHTVISYAVFCLKKKNR